MSKLIKNKLPTTILLALLLFLTSCGYRDLRGKISNSSDKKTYLIIEDDNGGQCGGIYVDGKKWPHAIGEKGPIEAGMHTIECGAKIEFNIPAGKTFHFDYWGP